MRDRIATLSNKTVCWASFNKFSLLQELSGTDAYQSLVVLKSIDRDVSKDEEADAEPHERDFVIENGRTES